MAFYILNPRTGIKEQVVNAEYYPAFLFLPERAFINYPSILESVTRYPGQFLWDQKSRDFVASDNFMLCIIDFYAYLAWPALAKMFGLCKYMEVYSGDDIAWRIAMLLLCGSTQWRRKTFCHHPVIFFNTVPLLRITILFQMKGSKRSWNILSFGIKKHGLIRSLRSELNTVAWRILIFGTVIKELILSKMVSQPDQTV